MAMAAMAPPLLPLLPLGAPRDGAPPWRCAMHCASCATGTSKAGLRRWSEAQNVEDSHRFTRLNLNLKYFMIFMSLICFRFKQIILDPGFNLGLGGDPDPSKKCFFTKAGANNGNNVGGGLDASLTHNVFLYGTLGPWDWPCRHGWQK